MANPTLPAVGAPAPDFTLPSTGGTDVALASFRGRQHVLVAFFPAAFTGVCTAEACAFSEDYERFASADTAVLPISVDQIPTLKEFKGKHAMRVELLADVKRATARAYGVLDENLFNARRSYFLIDKAGVLRWRHVEDQNRNRREDSELLAEIAKLA